MAQPGWIVDDYAAGGRHPVREFIAGVSADARVEAIALVKLLRERGNLLRRPHSAALGSGLFELRGVKHGVRIFYVFQPGQRIVLLDGIVKRQETIPHSVLDRVRRLQRNLEQRSRESRQI